MQTHLRNTVLAAFGCGMLAACGTEPQTQPQMMPSAQALLQHKGIPPQIVGYLTEILSSSVVQTAMMDLVEGRSNSAMVSELTQFYRGKNASLEQDITNFARQESIFLPATAGPSSDFRLAELATMFGSGFDHKYINYQSQNLQGSIKTAQTASSTSTDPNYVAFFTDLVKFLEDAYDIYQYVEKGHGSPTDTSGSLGSLLGGASSLPSLTGGNVLFFDADADEAGQQQQQQQQAQDSKAKFFGAPDEAQQQQQQQQQQQDQQQQAEDAKANPFGTPDEAQEQQQQQAQNSK